MEMRSGGRKAGCRCAAGGLSLEYCAESALFISLYVMVCWSPLQFLGWLILLVVQNAQCQYLILSPRAQTTLIKASGYFKFVLPLRDSCVHDVRMLFSAVAIEVAKQL